MPRENVHTRGIFRGVTRYARPFRAWNFHLGLPRAQVVAALRRWAPSGIIASIPDRAMERRIARLGLPMVNCSSDRDEDGINRVVSDNLAVGRLAAEHLLGRGCRHLGFCGEPKSLASRQRLEGLISRAEQVGVTVHRFVRDGDAALVGQIGWEVSSQDPSLQRWIAELPKPVGVLACHDHVAMLLSEVCLELGVVVPAEVAVLGVDNDAMLCEMAYPSLSSVQTPQEKIGFEAARRLDQLMNDGDSPPSVLRLPPQGVVTRQSTDALSADDAVVAQAMRFISEHADVPIRVSDVVEHVGGSRRSLESRFRTTVGQSVLSAIQQAHIALANELLSGTDASLEQIAEACGFNSRERFSHVYRQITGQTPRGAFPRTGPLDPMP